LTVLVLFETKQITPLFSSYLSSLSDRNHTLRIFRCWSQWWSHRARTQMWH